MGCLFWVFFLLPKSILQTRAVQLLSSWGQTRWRPPASWAAQNSVGPSGLSHMPHCAAGIPPPHSTVLCHMDTPESPGPIALCWIIWAPWVIPSSPIPIHQARNGSWRRKREPRDPRSNSMRVLRGEWLPEQEPRGCALTPHGLHEACGLPIG